VDGRKRPIEFHQAPEGRSRQDKQREKAERKTQRKQEKSGEPGGVDTDLDVLVDSSSDPFARNLGENSLMDLEQEE